MSNPMKQLIVKNQKLEFTLKQTEELAGDLLTKFRNKEKEHKELIEENVETENNFNECLETLSAFCEECVLKGTGECKKCTFYKLVVKFGIWND
jgi:hypothetical protein